MSKKSKIGIWLSIGFVAIAMVIGGYAMLDGLSKGTFVGTQPQQPESTPDKPKDGKEYEDQVLRAVEGAKAIKQAMKNPNSFQVEVISVIPSGAICYAYTTQSEAGDTNKGRAVLIKNEIKTDEMQGFDQQWQDECNGKDGKDVTGFGKLMIY
jgi:hypothetical protein